MKKVDIYGGKSPRELPLYTIAQAARVVRIHPATLRTWALGRSYPTQAGHKNWTPLIRAADPKKGMLSFANLVELHVLSTLRGKQVRIDRIRNATHFIREKMKTDHPLADVDTQTDCVNVYIEYMDRLVNASSSQTELRPLIERYLQRIERDENGLASSLNSARRSAWLRPARIGLMVPRRGHPPTDAARCRHRRPNLRRPLPK